MRPLLSLLLVVSCVPVLRAQAANTFLLYPDDARGATTFATRYSFGALAGEMLQQMPAANLVGIGDAGGTCSASTIDLILQDQNGATQENYELLVRAPTPFGTPDPNPSGILVQTGPLSTPPGSPGATSYLITVTFAAAVVLPCKSSFFYGVALAAAPGWTLGLDGASVHNAYNPPAGAVGSNARATAPVISWQIFDPGSGAIVGTAPTPRVANIGLGTDQAVLNLGNYDPASQRSPAGIDYGLGGLFPAAVGGSRNDGLHARISDSIHLGGTALLLFGVRFGTPIALPGFAGRIHLDLAAPIVQIGLAPITGTTFGYARFTIATPGFLPAISGGALCFQACTFDAGLANPHLTNAIAAIL